MASNTNNLTLLTNETRVKGNNIAAGKVPGFKKTYTAYSNSATGNGGASYLRGTTRTTNDNQGEMISTGVATDIAIQGQGLFVVKNGGVFAFTRRGDLRRDPNNNLSNGGGVPIYAWKLDEQGNKPPNSSGLDSLSPVTFSNVRGLPVATKQISLAVNLNSEKSSIRGSGIKFNINTSNVNTKKPNELLIPDTTGSGRLQLGDTFNLTATGGSNAQQKIEYGGVVISTKLLNGAKILGAENYDKDFAIGNGLGQIAKDSKFIVRVGSKTHTFIVGGEGANGFKSVASLAQSINQVSDLSAAIRAGRFIIGAADPQKAIAFESQGNDLVKKLGLYSIAASDPSVQRFNSMASLEKMINKNTPTSGISASIKDSTVSVYSADATTSFQIEAESSKKHKIHPDLVSLHDNTALTTDAALKIIAPMHNCKVGDWIEVSYSVAGAAATALVKVKEVDENSFTAEQAAAVSPLYNFNDASWRRVPGDHASRLADVATRKIFETGAAASRIMKYYIGTHQYSAGDQIKLSGVPNGKHVVDGLEILSDTPYTIEDKGADWVTFKLPEKQSDETTNNAATAGTTAETIATVPNVDTNHYSRVLEYFNIDQKTTVYQQEYNPKDVEKNLISGNFKNVFEHPIESLYDSLGNKFRLKFYYAKLQNNKWAVEIAAEPEVNDIKSGMIADNGLLRHGILSFDSEGFLQTPVSGFNQPIEFTINNGSKQNTMVIDWENKLGNPNGQVTQVAGDSSLISLESDGQSAGTLQKIEINANGKIIANFDNGDKRALYQIPIAMFPNVNGLTAGSNDTFETSRDSGELLLRNAGESGAGKILSGVNEASNVDITSELLELVELSNQQRITMKSVSISIQNDKNILNEIPN